MTYGLTSAEVRESRKRYGDNQLEHRKRRGFFRDWLAQFNDPIIRVLLGALALNAALCFRAFQWYEACGILASVLTSTIISTVSERRGGKAFEELQREASRIRARVWRDGILTDLPAEELVKGDAVELSAGDSVPADGVLLAGELHVDQSALNGESREAVKRPGKPSAQGNPGDAFSLFRGSTVTYGGGILKVYAVGKNTMYGELAGQLQEEAPDSPLKQRLTALAKTVSRLGYLAAGIVGLTDLIDTFCVTNYWHWLSILADFSNTPLLLSRALHALTLAVTIAVVAAPEGLPMMVAVVLSSNTRRMLKSGVLVRVPTGIETAGNINMLFCDKTGTLTTGKMSVDAYYTADSVRIPPDTLSRSPLSDSLLRGTLLNTQVKPSRNGFSGGNATERALAASVGKTSLKNYQVSAFEPFDSARKYSRAVCTDGIRRYTLLKGAPEVLLSQCRFYRDASGQSKPFLLSRVQLLLRRLTQEGFRVLVLCEAIDGSPMTFIAFAALRDPVRRDAVQAVSSLQSAGIHICMVTGDSTDTAQKIASETGLLADGGKILDSTAFSRLSDTEIVKILPDLSVVSRARPTDKTRLVRLSQSIGNVVGMTGDGVNDAPALNLADVGFAMGSGTSVAREAGDVVILDDSLTSVANAVLYGRTIFKSLRRFVIFQLTMNLCAVGISVLGPILGVPNPITVMQMLWVNLVMDTLAGLAFAGEPARQEYLYEPPVSSSEPLIDGRSWGGIASLGGFTLSLELWFLSSPFTRQLFGFRTRPLEFLTAFFVLFIFSAIAVAFTVRASRANLFADLARNPAFLLIMTGIALCQLTFVYLAGSLFRTIPLAPRKIAFCIILPMLIPLLGCLSRLRPRRVHPQSVKNRVHA